ncbi:MAG: DUF2490 domain-containing protein [Flavobacteriales bacterium]|nr:DUF2490 domain-containing protein [Flavobacteriales bacterium]MBP6641899.1 DUF2490 domain-containing protein [Flavobacteriales bacterium]MBP7156286.1 DUF2490 domain-containing protein [Flavobacteriales bacterium]
MRGSGPSYWVLFGFIVLLAPSGANGQSSPPGLGRGHTATWFAVGVEQQLDTLEKMHWVGYVGLGRKSDPNDYIPYHSQAILVVNQEFYHQFRRHWQYSLAVSYREQDEYAARAPYDHVDPSMKQEFRVYGRYSYLLNRTKWKFAATLRQEARKFYMLDFQPWEEDLQLRTRFRLQATWHLDQHKNTKLIISSEQLFATSREAHTQNSARLRYTESRFCLFLSSRPGDLPFVFSVGYMNNLLGRTTLQTVHYLALSAVWQNPFGMRNSNGREQSHQPATKQF